MSICIERGGCDAVLLSLRVAMLSDGAILQMYRPGHPALKEPTVLFNTSLSAGCSYNVLAVVLAQPASTLAAGQAVTDADMDVLAFRKRVYCTFSTRVSLADVLAESNVVDWDWTCWNCKLPASAGSENVCTHCYQHKHRVAFGRAAYIPVLGIPAAIATGFFDCGRARMLEEDTGRPNMVATAEAVSTVVLAAVDVALTPLLVGPAVKCVTGGVRAGIAAGELALGAAVELGGANLHPAASWVSRAVAGTSAAVTAEQYLAKSGLGAHTESDAQVAHEYDRLSRHECVVPRARRNHPELVAALDAARAAVAAPRARTGPTRRRRRSAST